MEYKLIQGEGREFPFRWPLHPGRTSQHQATVADLTGVAVQDIRITRAVLASLRPRTEAT